MSQLKLKIITISISIALSFLFAEAFSRVYFFGSAAISYSQTNSFGILDNSDLIKYSKTDHLKYELIPNLNTKYKLVDFKTNQEGFRDKDHVLSTNTTKIAVIGDSFTMGTGVEQSDMYVSRTETLLNKKDPINNYELFNFGVSGYALSHYFTLLEKNVLNLNPDLVIIGFCASNDHLQIGEDFTLEEFYIKPKKNVFWDSYLKKLIIVKLFVPPTKPISYSDKQIAYVNLEFNRLKNKLESHKTKGLIFYMDLIYDPIRVKKIETVANKYGLLFIDVSQKMQNKNLSKYILNELDPHPNGKANLIFAETLSSYILNNKTNFLQKRE